MSAAVLRCPNCGTVQGTAGECEACHDADVRLYCPNHTPGRWLDGPACRDCGARVDLDPMAGAPRPPIPGAAPPRRDTPLGPGPRAPDAGRTPPRAPAGRPRAPGPAAPGSVPPAPTTPRDPWATPPGRDPERDPGRARSLDPDVDRGRRARSRTRGGEGGPLGELFGPDGPFGPHGPFGRGGPFGTDVEGRSRERGGGVVGTPTRMPPVRVPRVPTVRVPGVFGCLARVALFVVFLILAALAGSFVWITQF